MPLCRSSVNGKACLAAVPGFTSVENVVSILLAWWVVPLTLLAFWFRFLPLHGWWLTALHVAVVAVATGFGVKILPPSRPHAER